MNYEDGQESTKSCVTATGGCTSEEFNDVKDVACGSTALTVSLAAVVMALLAGKFAI